MQPDKDEMRSPDMGEHVEAERDRLQAEVIDLYSQRDRIARESAAEIGRLRKENAERAEESEQLRAAMELARDALRRTGHFHLEEVGHDIAGMIDRYNAEARAAVVGVGMECGRLRTENTEQAEQIEQLQARVAELENMLAHANGDAGRAAFHTAQEYLR